MKKWFSIVMLIVYVFSMTEIHQLVKAPTLIEHYLEHQKEDKAISIISFLEIHYLNGNLIDKDYEKDMKLPFKSIQDTCYSQIVIVPNINIEIPTNPNISIENNSKGNIQDSQVFISNYFSSIWQPPKIA